MWVLCVCARVRARERQTALRAAIRVQQEAHLCGRKENPGSAGLVGEGGWRERWERCWKIHGGGTKARRARLLARMQICVVCVYCAINKGQVALGSLAQRSSRVSTATGASLLFPATLDAARL